MRAADAHKHYLVRRERVDGKVVDYRQCKYCSAEEPKRYSIGTSTTVLQQHVDIKHSATTIIISSSSSSSSSSSPSPSSSSDVVMIEPPPAKRSKQLSLHDTRVVMNNAALRPATALLFARCSWAHQAVEFPEFLDFIKCVRESTCDPPDRRGLRLDQIKLAQELRGRVVRQLRSYCRSSPLSIAIDGWTNVNSSKVTNVVIICGGAAYYWCSIVNSRNHNTAAWLRDPLVQVFNGIKAEGLIFNAFVADNERVNRTVWDLLLQNFPFLIRSPCAAHLVQLCVVKALGLPCIDPVLMAVEALLRQFRYKEARLKLKNLQIADNNGSFLNLLRPCDTRWSSWLNAIYRLLKVKKYVDVVTPQPQRFWSDLEDMSRFLKQFQLATDVIQQDSSTLYDVFQQFKRLLQHVRGLQLTSIFQPAKDDVINIIIDMWEKHINLDAIIICAQLSFDSAADAIFQRDQLVAAERWFLDFAAKYAVYWQLSTASNMQQAPQ
jgi:hypothetical protein